MSRILVVGAGFAGAVYARELAEAGLDVTVIDMRGHIGGNAFDDVDESGVRVHRYGPHLFHTSNRRVVSWLSRFTSWTPYEHRVVARLADGRCLPLPVNRDTVNGVFGLALADEAGVAAKLARVSVPRDPVRNAEDWLYSTIGPELTDIFFRPYTKKMWGMDLVEMAADVVRRVRIRTDREDRYFPGDDFQALPSEGYTALFRRIFDHPRIAMRLGVPFRQDMRRQYDFCFNSMPIDEFFDYGFGHLPYRSIKFHHKREAVEAAPPHVTVNYTDDGPMTRETWWHNMPGHHVRRTGTVLRTVEEPCDYRDNDFQRYYPVRTADGRYDALYARYRGLADKEGDISFIGRCGTYQYLDMHQVVSQSLSGARQWLSRRGLVPAEDA